MEEQLSQNDKIIWSCWESKSAKDVVREAAAKGTHINLAVKFLMEKNGWNESTARDWFLAEVIDLYLFEFNTDFALNFIFSPLPSLCKIYR